MVQHFASVLLELFFDTRYQWLLGKNSNCHIIALLMVLKRGMKDFITRFLFKVERELTFPSPCFIWLICSCFLPAWPRVLVVQMARLVNGADNTRPMFSRKEIRANAQDGEFLSQFPLLMRSSVSASQNLKHEQRLLLS